MSRANAVYWAQITPPMAGPQTRSKSMFVHASANIAPQITRPGRITLMMSLAMPGPCSPEA